MDAPLVSIIDGMPVVMEKMRAQHLSQVVSIETASYPDPWSLNAFMREIEESDTTVAAVAQSRGHVLGYIVAWIVMDELHIGNVAVEPQYRERGVARRMMSWLLDYAEKKRCIFSTLEVRESNQAARSLYASFGFSPVARRKSYYAYPTEDAIVMLKALREEHPDDAAGGG
jgi:ribosomal-protein-alanine N-acetyltransferase